MYVLIFVSDLADVQGASKRGRPRLPHLPKPTLFHFLLYRPSSFPLGVCEDEPSYLHPACKRPRNLQTELGQQETRQTDCASRA